MQWVLQQKPQFFYFELEKKNKEWLPNEVQINKYFAKKISQFITTMHQKEPGDFALLHLSYQTPKYDVAFLKSKIFEEKN